MTHFTIYLQILLCFVFLFTACQNQPSAPLASATAILPVASPMPSATPTFLPSTTPLPPTPTETPTAVLQLCSPLQGISLADIPGMVVNPFAPPRRPGSDDPHQGVDLAQVGEGNIALPGLQVQAVLAGRVAGVIADRFPYGNALIIETSLELLPSRWWVTLALPTPAPTLATIPALTCIFPEPMPEWSAEPRSLYLLYAHMQTPPTFQPDEGVTCAGPLGEVGDTGNAINPHLHLETRIGPSGVRFSSLAHYDPSASIEEMFNYCTWRVSGLFQLVDPLAVLMLGGGE